MGGQVDFCVSVGVVFCSSRSVLELCYIRHVYIKCEKIASPNNCHNFHTRPYSARIKSQNAFFLFINISVYI